MFEATFTNTILIPEPSDRDRELLDRINSFQPGSHPREKTARIEEINTPGLLLTGYDSSEISGNGARSNLILLLF